MNSNKKTFKYKYNNDPNFKNKILKRALEKINCPKCNRTVMRSNLSRHKKSNICFRNLINS